MLYIGLQHRSFFDCALGKKYYEVKIDDDTFLTAHQMKQLQKRNDQLEENLILKSDCHIHASLDELLKVKIYLKIILLGN